MSQTFSSVHSLFGISVQRNDKLLLAEFPPFYASMFDAINARIGDRPCIMLEVKGEVKLRPLLKAIENIEATSKTPCVVVSNDLTSYQKNRLSEEGIAWLLSSETFHIPFLGMASSRERKAKRRSVLTSQAFRVLALYLSGEIDGMSTQQVAMRLGKGLSVTCGYFAELGSLFPEIVGTEGRRRFLDPGMRNDVIERIVGGKGSLPFAVHSPERHYYKANVDASALLSQGFKKSGLTALSSSTMIADNGFPTLAIGKKRFSSNAALQAAIVVSEGDDPDLLVEAWPYELDDRHDDSVYPLEIWLSLKEEAADERIYDALVETLRRSL